MFDIIVWNMTFSVAFEVSLSKAYDCWAVFSNKQQQFRIIDPWSSDVPLDYIIVHDLILSFASFFLFWLLFVCGVLFSLSISSNFSNLFEVVIGAGWVILLIEFCFFKRSIFRFLNYASVDIGRSDWWSLSLFICWFGHLRIFFGYFLIHVSIWFGFCTSFSLFYFCWIHSFNVFLKCWPFIYTQIYYFFSISFLYLSIGVMFWSFWFVFWAILAYVLVPHIAFNNFPGFWKRYILCVLYMHHFLFPLAKLTGPWKGSMLFMIICTLYIFAFILSVWFGSLSPHFSHTWNPLQMFLWRPNFRDLKYRRGAGINCSTLSII